MTTWFRRLTILSLALAVVLAGLALMASASPVQAADAQWTARYWDNRSLSGDPVMTRLENNIDHDWGHDSPNLAVLGTDNFSARWTRSVNFAAGTYRFTATVDDGVRLWVDDRQIIDSWTDSQVRSLSADVTLTAGDHNVRMEFYEAGGVAVAKLNWTAIGGQPPTQSATWRGEYFIGTAPSGSPALVRTDPAISFNWGNGSPAPQIPADQFSARWTTTVNLNPGTYRFQVLTDDGVRLWVNDQRIIDQWHDARGETYLADVAISGGPTSLRMEYYENTGDARAHLAWARTDGTGGQVGTGAWLGQYFSNRTLQGTPTLVRNDNDINFNWGLGSPAAGISADNFSVRWTRSLPLAAGLYRFTATSDDGVRVWVNEEQVINAWSDRPPTTVSGQVRVPGGSVPVRVEYYEHGGGAQVQLSWQLIAQEGTTPPPAATGTATVQVPRLNVREGPGTRFDILGTLTAGQTVPLTGHRDQTGSWVRVIFNNNPAWVSALPGYLNTSIPVSSMPEWTIGPGNQPVPNQPLATVGSQVFALNMRTGPGTNFEVIRALRAGTVVWMIGRTANAGWLQVRTADGTVGWVSAPFMIPTTPVNNLPVTG